MRRSLVVFVVSLLVFGNMPLTFAATGPVGTITGIAKSTAGDPLDGYTVRVRSVRTGELITTTTTGISGTFVATSLSPGSYVVEVVDRAGRIVGASTIATVLANRTASVGIVAASTERVGGALSKKGLYILLAAGGAAAVTGIVIAANDNNASPSD